MMELLQSGVREHCSNPVADWMDTPVMDILVEDSNRAEQGIPVGHLETHQSLAAGDNPLV